MPALPVRGALVQSERFVLLEDQESPPIRLPSVHFVDRVFVTS